MTSPSAERTPLGLTKLTGPPPATSDRLKCQLKPIDRSDYTPPLTDAQFVSLKGVFPQGVCDYSKKGVSQRAPDAWLSYPQPGTNVPVDRHSNSRER
jgi:hypothetical protein